MKPIHLIAVLILLCGSIQAVSANETYVYTGQWGGLGFGEDGKFQYAYGVDVDSAGNIYVVDMGNTQIQIFTPSGTFIRKIAGTYGSGSSQFKNPYDLAVDGAGNIYVADTGNNRIQKFSPSGVYLTKWGSPGSGNGSFNEPQSVAVDREGNVYVADYYNHRIQKFAATGEFITKWGDDGSAFGQFGAPTGVAVDSAGFVYVAHLGGYPNPKHVSKFTSNGTLVRSWGSTSPGDGEFDRPSGIAVDHDGNVFVSDEFAERIQKFTSDGTFITNWGDYGTGDGLFYYPRGVSIDAAGTVYVADSVNNRIQKFVSVTPIRVIPGGISVPLDLNSDGKFEDVNGNGRKDFADIVLFFNQMSWIAANEPMMAFDYNNNERIDFADVVWLFNNL